MADTTTITVLAVLLAFAALIAALVVYRCVCSSRRAAEEETVRESLLAHAAGGGGARHAGGGGYGSQQHSGSEISGASTGTRAAHTGRYAVQRKLGDGTYGVVYLAKRAMDDKKVAIKIVPCQDAKAADDAMREFHLCQALQGHPNMIQLLDVFEDLPGKPAGGRASQFGSAGVSDTVPLKELRVAIPSGFEKALCIVTEFYEEGTLFDLLVRRNAGLPESLVWSFTQQTLEALVFMHTNNIIHRDIKPSNVLLARGCERLVLTDFGLSREVDPDQYMHTKIGTYHYMAPEQLQRRYNAKVDVWATGCLIYAMCTVRVSVKDAVVMFNVRRQASFEPNFTKELKGRGYSDELINFCLALLTEAPAMRPSSEEALRELRQIMARRSGTTVVPVAPPVVAAAGGGGKKSGSASPTPEAAAFTPTGAEE